MRRPNRPTLLLLIGFAIACGEEPFGPRTATGALEASVAPGAAPPTQMGTPSRSIRARPRQSASTVPSPWTLSGQGFTRLPLSGLAANCALDGPNPRSITIAGGATLQVALRIDCAEAGALEVVTETSGGSPDVDGYAVTVDAGADQVIAASGTLTVTGLVVGEHRIALGGVAAHCRVSGENPRVAQLDIVETTRVTFAVACPGPGSVAVAANTTGQQLDLDGYTVALDGGSESALPSGGSVTLEAVPPGQHAVALGGIASNCAVSGTNPVTVAVQGDGIAAVTFQVSCSGEPGPGAGELLFTSNRSGATHLYRIRRDGTGLVDLTPAVSGSGGRWSPDGSRILFSSVRDGNAELFVMDADGTTCAG